MRPCHQSPFSSLHNECTLIRRSDIERWFIFVLTAHFDSNGKALKQLVASHTDSMYTNDAFFRPDHYQLEQRWFFVIRGDHGEV